MPGALPEPDYVDQIDNGQASVVSPGGAARTVAVADLPQGAKEGDYLSGGQVVAAPADDGAPVRARLSAGDDGGTISLDGPPAVAAPPDGVSGRLPQDQLDAISAKGAYAPPAAVGTQAVAQPAGLTSKTQISGTYPGLVEAGNIDLTSRPQVKNADGSISTVRSASFNIDGKEVLLPTVSDDGRLLTDQQAIEQYKLTGQHLGKFATPDAADAYAVALHNQQATTLPGATTAAAGAPPAGPATLPPGSADLEQRIKDTTDASAKATTNLGEKEEQAATDIGQAYADKAELQRQQAADMAAHAQYVHDRQAALDKEDADALKEAQQKTIPDFWAGNEGGKVGAAITVALSGFFGGALAGATGTTFHNQALEAIQHNVDAYYGREKEKIDNLYQYAERKGMLDEKTKARYASELTDLMQQHAYTLASAADRIQQVQAESQGQVDKAKADQMAAALQGQATSELQQARGLDIKRFDSESDRMKAEADQLRAQADMVKANAVKNKHKGGGGGGGDALGKFVEAASGLKPGDPITPEIAMLGRAAGLKPNQVASEADKYRNTGAKSAATANAGGIKDERLVDKEAEEWKKGNGIDAITKKQHEIGAVLDEIKNAPHNPLQQALAIEKAVSSARGGAASRQALDLALHHLGGKWDTIQAFVQGAKDGEIAAKQMDNFIGFMTTQLGTAQKEGKDAYDNFEKYRASQPPARQQLLEQARGKIFSGLHGFGGGSSGSAGGAAAHPSTAEVGATRQGPDGKTYRKVGPNNWQPVAQ